MFPSPSIAMELNLPTSVDSSSILVTISGSPSAEDETAIELYAPPEVLLRWNMSTFSPMCKCGPMEVKPRSVVLPTE